MTLMRPVKGSQQDSIDKSMDNGESDARNEEGGGVGLRIHAVLYVNLSEIDQVTLCGIVERRPALLCE